MNLRLAQDISSPKTGLGGQGVGLILALAFVLTTRCLAFDHTYRDYADVLARFDKGGNVNYEGLRSDRAALDRFLGEASVLPFEEYQAFSREEKMAFMINLYNAAALALVSSHPGMKSVNELKGFFRDAWSIRFIRLFNRTIGLSHLLNDILRPEFKDPRVHFALVTATRGDAALLDVPYRPEIVSQQLDNQTDQFMTQRPEVNRLENGTLYLSPKFKWYAVDFGKRPRLLDFVRRYFPAIDESTPIEYTRYDWSLNSQ